MDGRSTGVSRAIAADRLRGEIIERLTCDFQVDIGAVCRRHRADPARPTRELARPGPLLADGFARADGTRVKVSSPAGSWCARSPPCSTATSIRTASPTRRAV